MRIGSPIWHMMMGGGENPILFRYSAGDSIAALGGTFTRSSTGTYRDVNGVLQSAASGVARDAHYELDPVSGLYVRAALLEGQRTNLVLHSVDTSGWTSALVTRTTVASTEFGSNSFSLNEGASSGVHRLYPATNTAFTAVPHTFSGFFKASTGNRVFLRADSTTNLGATFRLDLGTVSASGAGITAGIQSWGNGWYRCWITWTPPVVNSVAIIYMTQSDHAGAGPAYLGTGLEILCAHPQIELGSFPSSYIPTTSATVTRAADSLTFTQATAGEALTQYERYWNQATAAFTDDIATISGGANYPNQPTNFRAYRDILVAKGARDLAYFRAIVSP